MSCARGRRKREAFKSREKKLTFVFFLPTTRFFFWSSRGWTISFFAVFLLCRLLGFLGASNISVDLSKSQEMPKNQRFFEEILRFPPRFLMYCLNFSLQKGIDL